MSYRLNRFQPPEDLTDQAIKLNNLYYKRLDMLEEIRKLENSLDEANQTGARKIREEIAVLQEEAWQLERRMDDMGCSP